MNLNPTQISDSTAVTFVAVINSFNRCALLKKSLEALTESLRAAPFASAILVFEAGSTDGSKEFLTGWRSEFPADRLTVVEATAGQSSFSDGVNAGCASALAMYPECRWLFLYETDNWLSGPSPLLGAITLLEAQADLAAVGFTVRRHSGLLCGYGMRFPTLLSFIVGTHLMLRWHLDAPNDSPWQQLGDLRWRTCDIVFTSPLVIRRQAWEKTGGLDARDFPFSDCDLDWAWRCAEQKWQLGVIDGEGVVHDNLQQASDWSATRTVDFHRSRLRLLLRYRGAVAHLAKPFLCLRHAAETLLLLRRGNKSELEQRKLAQRRQMMFSVWKNYRSR